MFQSKLWSKLLFLFMLLGILFVLTSTAPRTNIALAQDEGQTADAGVFTSVTLPVRASPLPLGEEVIRSRYVTVDLNAFTASHNGMADAAVTVNPFAGLSWTAVRDSLQQSPTSGSVIWNGHLEGVPNSQATFVVNGDVMIGKLAMPGAIYEISYSGIADIHQIKQINQSIFIDHDAEVPLPPAESIRQSSVMPDVGYDLNAADDGTTIDLLVVYSPEARAGAGGTAAIEATIELALVESNIGYQNTGVDQQLVLVHMYESPNGEQSSMCGSDIFCTDGDLALLRSSGDGYIDGVHVLRDEYHADFVVLIKETDGGCGLAYLQTSIANSLFEDDAFGVTKRSCALGNYTFAHELGHNMGLQHDWYADDAVYAVTHSHGYVNRTDGWRTIMAYNALCADTGGSCTRLLYFSNDTNDILGDPMGVTSGTASNCVEESISPNPENCDADNESVLAANRVSNSQFRASQITWLGNNSNWNDSNNWEILEGPVNRSSGASSTTVNRVPRSIDDVYIPASPSGGNFPTLSGDFEARNVLLQTGASLTINSGTLTIFGDWEEQGTATTTTNGGTVVFAGVVEQTIKTNTGSNFNNLQIGTGSSSTQVKLNSDIDVDGNLTIETEAQLFLDTRTIAVGGNWDEQTLAGLSVDTGTVAFDGATQTVSKTTPLVNLITEDFSEGDGQGCGCNTAFLPEDWIAESNWFGGEISGSGVGFASGDGWLHSPPVRLLADVNYDITFNFDSRTGSKTLRLFYGTASHSSVQTNVIGTISADGTGNFSFSVSESGVYHIGLHHNGTGQSTIDNFVLNLNDTQDLNFYNLQVGSSNSIAFGADVNVDNNMTINSGSLVDLTSTTIKVDGSVTNNGTLRESKTVSNNTDFAMIRNIAENATTYYGLEINNPAGNMGSTTVDVSGGQDCSLGSGNFVSRCFDITPTTDQSADILFYFTEAERNGLAADTLIASRWNGSTWVGASSTATYTPSEAGAVCSSNNGIGCSVGAATVTNYAQFILWDGVVEPEIQVTVDGNDLADGGTVDFGSTIVNNPVLKTLTISNTGQVDLTLSNLSLPAGYSVDTAFTSPVAPGNATSLIVQLDAGSINSFSGAVSFDNNDSDENPFNFTATGEVTAVPAPEIQVIVDSVAVIDGGIIDFGTTTIGTPVTKTVVINNTGTADLTLSNLSALPSGFSLDTLFASSVAAGESTTLVIQLDAASINSFSGVANFENNDDDEDPFDFTLTGEVEAIPEPEIGVSLDGSDVPDGGSVDFGSTTVGTAISRTFTISNTGTSTLTLANLSVPAGFAITADFGVTDVPTNTETSFTVELTAVAPDTYSGTLSFDNNDITENPYDILIEGVVTEVPAPEIAVVVDSANVPNGNGLVDFGSTVIGDAITETVTIQNVGTADLIISNFTVPNGFTATVPVSVTIPAAGETAISLTLEAAVSGLYTGTVSMDTNDDDENPFTFNVEGNVTDTPEPEIQLLNVTTNVPDGGALDLGSTPFETPVIRELTVRNIGTADLIITETITVPNGYTAEIGDTVLSPDSTTLLTVTLTADTAGTFTGTILIVNNDSNENPFNLEILGIVEEELLPEIDVFDGATLLIDDVSTVDLGTTDVGTPVTRTMTITNSGTADLTISDLVVSGSGFSLADGFGNTTIAPSGSTTFVVQLDGTTAGTLSGSVTFNSNDADETPFNFTLSGTVEESGGLAIYLPLITR